MTRLRAFNAMTNLLDDNYQKTKSDNVGVLLGGMQQFEDGGTFDPAMWYEWIESIEKVRKLNGDELTELEGFKAMKKFLELYYNHISKPYDIRRILKTLEVSSDDKPINSDAWNLWFKCIKKAIEDEDKPYKSPFV